jgi:RNA polymerase sigma-70 factor (ECF subfamily)
MAEPDLETVRRAQAGDHDAIASLVSSQQRYVYSIAMSMMRNPSDAADLTQDAFIRLMRSIGTFRGETKFATWLYRLVVNLSLDRLRRSGQTTVRLDDDSELDLATSDPMVDAPSVAERREVASVVRRAVEQLPEGQRLALTLHYFEDMRYEDIADVMGVPLNTVKSHIRRGKERLSGMLAPFMDDRPAMRCTQ